jgi:hypothetical protein
MIIYVLSKIVSKMLHGNSCTFYLYKIYLGLNKKKCIFVISVFMKNISLKEEKKKKFTKDTLFSKQHQRISEQLI